MEQDVKVIKFPRGGEKKKLDLAQSEPEHGQMYLGSFTFTCPCGTSAKFEPQNVIFRSLEFYCSKCGAPHKVTNPAFVPNNPSKTK